MAYVISQLWAWLLSIFVIGVLTAILVRQPVEKRWVAGWMLWACLALLAASTVAGAGALAGRPGLYVESGVASFAAFILGGFLGTRFTGGSLREHKGWALGLGPVGLIWLGACYVATPAFEADLKRRAGKEIENAGGDPSKLEFAGRDAILPVDVADRDKLVTEILRVKGVRRVASGVDGALVDARTEAPRKAADAANATASVKTEVETEAIGAEKGSAERTLAEKDALDRPPQSAPVDGSGRSLAAGPTPAPEAVAATASPPAKEAPGQGAAKEPPAPSLSPETSPGPDRAKAAAAILAALPASGELNAESCQAALSATVMLEKVEFGGGNAKIRFVAAPVLDRVTAVLKRCPKVKMEIGVHLDAPGSANQKLSQQRADKLISYFERAGIERGRLTGVGYGASKPIASNATEEGRAQNRRIEFVVR